MSKIMKNSNNNNNKEVITSSIHNEYDDLISSSSIMEFLSKEQECDADSIFQEVSRIAGDVDGRSVDELIREAESLLRMNGSNGGDDEVKGNHCVSSKKSKIKVQQTIQTKMNSKYTKSIENVRPITSVGKRSAKECSTPNPNPALTPIQTPHTPLRDAAGPFAAFVDNLPTESVISEESTPNDMQNLTITANDNDTTIEVQLNDDDDTDEGTDTMEEITECMETLELSVDGENNDLNDSNNATSNDDSNEVLISVSNGKTAPSTPAAAMATATASHSTRLQHTKSNALSVSMTTLGSGGGGGGCGPTVSSINTSTTIRRPSCDTVTLQKSFYTSQMMPSPSHRNITPLNFNPTQACSPTTTHERRNSIGARRASMNNTPDSGHYSQTTASPRRNSPPLQAALARRTAAACDKSVNSSPKHYTSTQTSPIQAVASLTREHALKQEIDHLQEKLKDTEERLQSLRIQHDSLSHLHRDLRESNTRLQEESEILKLDVQHLNECANVLRTELQAARNDRNEALELQKALQAELDETRQEKKRTQEQKDSDAKTIQDLQRQCREMERILMRKHPDSVSALIVASKSPGHRDHDNLSSRKLLEQRIAQLEADAKEQDKKAQQILANVQARFNSVQAKYETHIADLETQVLSLQEINTKLNEKIESQVRTLDYFVRKRTENYYNNSTQTDEPEILPNPSAQALHAIRALSPLPSMTYNSGTQTIKSTRDHSTNTIGGATGSSQTHSAGSSASSTTNSTPINSRPSSKQSGLRKPMNPTMSLSTAVTSKLPVSQSDSTISLSAHHAAAREDAHLLATIRGMRVDLAVKDKAIQRLSRELDECKKTIKKLQREKDAVRSNTSSNVSGPSSSTSILRRNQDHHTPANTETQALREAQSKLKLMEADYKSLHDKRLQDLKALQTAHERELAFLHQRLNDREESNGVQKRRKLPVDYYALKAKVSSLERRHTEREERLHLLVDALSKGRLNGALEDLMRDNNNK